MHLQIRKSTSGKCPICGMDLVLVDNNSNIADPSQINLSYESIQMANIQTMVVEKEIPGINIRLNGKIQLDERNIFTQTSHISGRIDQLKINYTGDFVNKGQTLAVVYSPDLVTAQKELFEAYKVKDNQPELFQAAKMKLSNWKITDTQINNILSTGKPTESFPILSDVEGVILNKHVSLGDHIMPGSAMFEVGDLSRVWVLFDIYEKDLSQINTGQTLTYTVSAYPGQTFNGTISFIDPVIDQKSRVAHARVEVNNRDGKLKPEMLVTGHVNAAMENQAPGIIIPKSAVMWTGERSLVYIKSKADHGLLFKMREVTLGTELKDKYVILNGLELGEEIAVNGTFSIDAAAQLAGKPSMMNSFKAESMNEPLFISIENDLKAHLSPIVRHYLDMKDALVESNFSRAKEAGLKIDSEMSQMDDFAFGAESRQIWQQYKMALEKEVKNIMIANNLIELRDIFINLSQTIIALNLSFHPMQVNLYVQHCPMANENMGAKWLSLSSEIKNPYFGDHMLACGSVINEIKY